MLFYGLYHCFYILWTLDTNVRSFPVFGCYIVIEGEDRFDSVYETIVHRNLFIFIKLDPVKVLKIIIIPCFVKLDLIKNQECKWVHTLLGHKLRFLFQEKKVKIKASFFSEFKEVNNYPLHITGPTVLVLILYEIFTYHRSSLNATQWYTLQRRWIVYHQ